MSENVGAKKLNPWNFIGHATAAVGWEVWEGGHLHHYYFSFAGFPHHKMVAPVSWNISYIQTTKSFQQESYQGFCPVLLNLDVAIFFESQIVATSAHLRMVMWTSGGHRQTNGNTILGRHKCKYRTFWYRRFKSLEKTNKYNTDKYPADGPERHVVMHLQRYLVSCSGVVWWHTLTIPWYVHSQTGVIR